MVKTLMVEIQHVGLYTSDLYILPNVCYTQGRHSAAS